MRKATLLALLGTLLAIMTAFMVPAASTSASTVPQSHSARSAIDSPAQVTFGTLCQSGNTIECLNLTLCNTSDGVQLWNYLRGGACTSNWSVVDAGTVDPAKTYPFYCGDGLNSAYNNDEVFSVLYLGSNASIWAPTSAGNNNTVTLTKFGGNYLGYWVQQDNNGTNGPTRLIDVTTTCKTHQVQHVYAGCAGDGCLVREGLNPTSGEYWDWELYTTG